MAMHRALPSRWLNSALRIAERASVTEVPGYLCPALGSFSRRGHGLVSRTRKLQYGQQQRCLHLDSTTTSALEEAPSLDSSLTKNLPLQCHGCGAFSQTSEPDQAGYYDVSRKAVRRYLGQEQEQERNSVKEERGEDYVVDQALQNLDESKKAELGLNAKTLHFGEELDPHATFLPSPPKQSPLCDRCHRLVHHHDGTPIYHPTVDALRDTIAESPYKYNHIYHVIDAADFPMSLVPKLHQLLGDVTLRRRNRRSRAGRYYKDRKFEMSFIITRADLLAPTEKQVNSLMPYLREVLRDKLGEFGDVVRLGNLKCVSAKRGWWTKDLKQEIYKRGGAGWMVGKVNVGKSQLFEAVFPKGTTVDLPLSSKPVEVSMFAREEDSETVKYIEDELPENGAERLELDALLPPARPEINYPEMPTVSALPGTTASPIRIPYGNGKGELIDLPGLARSDLELFVKEEHRSSMILQQRLKPEQHSIKPGQSLLIGGLIRITPKTANTIFLGYNFTPLPEHLTSTEKAIEFQEQTRIVDTVQNLAGPEAASKMAHAGTFELKEDVTKLRAGPITRKDAINIKVENLPYRVLSTDILIEGVGWVELTAQVRSKALFAPLSEKPQKEGTAPEESAEGQGVLEKKLDPFEAMEAKIVDTMARAPSPKQVEVRTDEPPKPRLDWPVVDVYSPLGKFVSSRAPLNGYVLNKPRVLAKHKKKRPGPSMKGAKKRMKAARRAAAAAG